MLLTAIVASLVAAIAVRLLGPAWHGGIVLGGVAVIAFGVGLLAYRLVGRVETAG